MKKTLAFALIIFIICIMTAGCVQSKLSQNQTPQVTQTPVPVLFNGRLNVSIGSYDATMPVFVDNVSVGDVSRGKPLSFSVKEGRHSVKVCSGPACEQVDVEIKSAIDTTIDFENRFLKNIPQGSLNVSIGDYTGKVAIFINDTQVGEVFPGKSFTTNVKEGLHTVRASFGNVSVEQEVAIKTGKQTDVDFGDQLTNATPTGSLTVSIGGYNANNLPVYVDNRSVGEVSQNKPFSLMLNEGSHDVRICVAQICENETVDIRFAKKTVALFQDRLKQDREFTKPTVRIVDFILNGNTYILNMEYINPTINDTTITATIGCAYSYIDYSNKARKNTFAQTQQKMLIKAGTRETHALGIDLSAGSNVIASDPSLVDVSIT